MRAGSLRIALALACAFLAFLACPGPAAAHRLDEYLQASRLSVSRERIGLEIDLTPGVAVAPQIFELIDTDHDGQVSAAEGEAYARLVLDSIALSVDGRRLQLALVDRRFPEFSEMESGLGAVRLRGSATFPPSASGLHHVYYRNVHQSQVGAYLVNALVPDDKQIEISQQRRDYEQHELTIDYRVVSDVRWSPLSWLVAGFAMIGVLIGTRRVGRH